MHVQPLESRSYFANPVDVGWQFSQAEVNATFGSYLSLEQGIDAGRGRTIVVARAESGPDAEIVIVALDSAGRLDRTFSDDGIMPSGLTIGPPTVSSYKVLATEDGYVYVANGAGVVRLRGNGTRDRAFGGGRAVDFTGGKGVGHTLALAANDVGGVDVVRTTGDLFGVVGTPALEGFEGTVRLVRVAGEGSRGRATEIWHQSFAEVTQPQTDETAPHLVQAHLTPQHGGGWVLVTARQRKAYYYPNSGDTDIAADVDIYYIDANGAQTDRRTFDVGRSAAISHVRVHTRGGYVSFVYGERRLSIDVYGRVRRQTLPNGPGTPALPTGQTFLLDGEPVLYNGGYTDQFASLTLRNPNGTIETSFADDGVFNFAGLPIAGAFTFSVETAQHGSALVGWTTADRSGGGNPVYAKHLYRLWISDEPTATVTSAVARDRTATITVRYRADDGIVARTVNSNDLKLFRRSRSEASVRLILRVIDGDTVVGTYRAVGLSRGTYEIRLNPEEIGTGSNARHGIRLLGYVTVT